jgi:hypothetical protein
MREAVTARCVVDRLPNRSVAQDIEPRAVIDPNDREPSASLDTARQADVPKCIGQCRCIAITRRGSRTHQRLCDDTT